MKTNDVQNIADKEINRTLSPIVFVCERLSTKSPKKTIIGYMRSVDVSSNQLERQQNALEGSMLRDGVDLSTVKWIRADNFRPHTSFLNHIPADIKAVYVTEVSRISRKSEYLHQVISYFRENDIKLYTATGLVNFDLSLLFTSFLYPAAQGGSNYETK